MSPESTLRRVAALLGRPLSDDEVASVLKTLESWNELARTLPAEQVVEIIKLETATTTTH
jgi:hypothetical protein